MGRGGLGSRSRPLVVEAGALDSEVAAKTILTSKGLCAGLADKVALALVDRSLMALKVVLARE